MERAAHEHKVQKAMGWSVTAWARKKQHTLLCHVQVITRCWILGEWLPRPGAREAAGSRPSKNNSTQISSRGQQQAFTRPASNSSSGWCPKKKPSSSSNGHPRGEKGSTAGWSSKQKSSA
ncbi:hypothetical protein VIGAN_06085800 [Vigna angularis var. angularis]|uniref:Uncharacterized protein n=1 Tax=Vigna angularis var. angularis TaxID=157739 RepID=A0A0S3SAB0_PHAAN|nr:hypothetical protein VIGAN_06085800 [Vigna angularis var. angularis]